MSTVLASTSCGLITHSPVSLDPYPSSEEKKHLTPDKASSKLVGSIHFTFNSDPV